MRTLRMARHLRGGLCLPLAAAILAAMTGGCSKSAPVNDGYGPAVTLRIGVYGDPGYRQAGLLAEYQRLHPDIRIVEDAAATGSGYWRSLQHRLAAGTGLDHIQAIPVSRLPALVGAFAADFVPLSTLGATQIQGDWLPWTWQAANHGGAARRSASAPASAPWACATSPAPPTSTTPCSASQATARRAMARRAAARRAAARRFARPPPGRPARGSRTGGRG